MNIDLNKVREIFIEAESLSTGIASAVAVGDIRVRVFLWEIASKQVRLCLKGYTSFSALAASG